MLVLGSICKKVIILDYKKSTSFFKFSFIVWHEEDYFRSHSIEGPCSQYFHKVHDTLHQFHL